MARQIDAVAQRRRRLGAGGDDGEIEDGKRDHGGNLMRAVGATKARAAQIRRAPAMPAYRWLRGKWDEYIDHYYISIHLPTNVSRIQYRIRYKVIFIHIRYFDTCGASLCPLRNLRNIHRDIIRIIGQLPIIDGLFRPPLWHILEVLPLRPDGSAFGKWSLRRHDRDDATRDGRHRAPQIARDLLRVLPAEDRGDGEEPVGHHQPAGAACAQFRLGDLWRRRLDPRAHPFHHRPHPATRPI